MTKSLKRLSHSAWFVQYIFTILLKKVTTVKNEVALSYYRVRGLHFLAVIFVSTIILTFLGRY